MNKGIVLVASDSSKKIQINSRYLPGGMLNKLFRSIANMFKINSKNKDAMGRWSTFILKGKWKRLKIFSIYRILDSRALVERGELCLRDPDSGATHRPRYEAIRGSFEGQESGDKRA